MLVIRDAQLLALAEGQLRRLRAKALEHLAARHAEKVAALGPEQTRASVEHALERAVRYGINKDEHVLRYLDAMYVLGFDFDRRPPLAAVMGDPQADVSLKLVEIDEALAAAGG